MAHTKRFTRQVIFVVVSITLILGFGIDLYTPSLPAIMKGLKTTSQLVQLTISIYFLGYMLGVMFLGPLSDAYGRKRPLVYGLLFYCIVSVLCGFSTNIYILLFLRLLQGIGVAGVGVSGRPIFSDIFTGKRLAIAMSYFSMSYRIGPLIAPLIGGYLEVYFGWPSNFYFLAIYAALVLVIIVLFLPETHVDRCPFQPTKIFEKYFAIFKYRAFISGSICLGIFYGIMIVFNIIGPFFIQEILHYSPIVFGQIAFIMGCGTFLGILANRLLLQYKSVKEAIALGVYATCFIGVLQVILAFLFPLNLYSFIVPVFLILFSTGFINSNLMSHLIDLIPHGKGIASALLSILLISCAGVITVFSSFLKSDTIRPFALLYFALIVVCSLSYHFLFRKSITSKCD